MNLCESFQGVTMVCLRLTNLTGQVDLLHDSVWSTDESLGKHRILDRKQQFSRLGALRYSLATKIESCAQNTGNF